jgi:hypothetical protein
LGGWTDIVEMFVAGSEGCDGWLPAQLPTPFLGDFGTRPFERKFF